MTGQGTFPLGPLGVIHGGPQCPKCAAPMPVGQALCPTCGADRGLEGSPYPSGRYERFEWIAAQKIGPTEKLVLVMLAIHDKPDSKGIFPGHCRLAAFTGLNERSVRRALARLRSDGWVAWEQHWRRGQLPNRYVIRQAETAFMADSVSVFKADSVSA